MSFRVVKQEKNDEKKPQTDKFYHILMLCVVVLLRPEINLKL
jgi:hypothetical protein